MDNSDKRRVVKKLAKIRTLILEIKAYPVETQLSTHLKIMDDYAKRGIANLGYASSQDIFDRYKVKKIN